MGKNRYTLAELAGDQGWLKTWRIKTFKDSFFELGWLLERI